MKKTIIRTEFVRTLDEKTGRIKITFPVGYLSAYGIAGTVVEKTLLENTLPSKQTTILAVNGALENIGFKGLVYYRRGGQGNYGHMLELHEDLIKTPKILKVDMKLLKKQKRLLLRLRGQQAGPATAEALDGVINMLDDIGDAIEDSGAVKMIRYRGKE